MSKKPPLGFIPEPLLLLLSTILPLRKEIQQESLLHYNGMLKDLSSFIADTRMNILARAQFIEAKLAERAERHEFFSH